jgi:type I restriction enzyme S subunit
MALPTVDWQSVTIGDLGTVVTGGTPSSKRPELYGDVYPFITPTDIDDSRRFVQTDRFLSEEGKNNQIRRLLPSGAVCFVCIGATIGKICMTRRPSFTNQQINSVIVDSRRHDNDFIYYLLRIKRATLKSIAGGAATPIVNKSTFSATEVCVPPLRIQRKIAAILSAYDDLIENNLRRIQILEEMAQALYREWFVKFRFPGHEKVRMVDSPLGKIPEGWEVKHVWEAFEIRGGGTPSKKVPEYWEGGGINWYVPTDLTAARSMFMIESASKITELGLRKSSARLFPAFSVMMTSRATVGVISINTTEACTNQGFITCIPNDRFPLYTLYQWLKENVSTFISLGTGATFKEITKGVFKTIEVLVPPQFLVTAFEGAVAAVGEHILNLHRKNTNLRHTRDLLLPKLISGQLDVSELDIAVDGTAA